MRSIRFAELERGLVRAGRTPSNRVGRRGSLGLCAYRPTGRAGIDCEPNAGRLLPRQQRPSIGQVPRYAVQSNPSGLNMDFGLTTEQQMVVDTVRGFVEKELYPHEEEVERTGQVPSALGESIKRKVIDLGFYAPNLPEEVGGGGLDNLTFALLERELGRASMALSVFWGRPSGILMGCRGDQRERYLYPAARGERFDALAMTEPGAGSDLRGMQCSARQDGDGLDPQRHQALHLARGSCRLCHRVCRERGGGDRTWSEEAHHVLPRRPRNTGFRDSAGLRTRFSHRGYHNCILTFDDCRLPSAQILGELHRGFELASEWLFATRITVAAMCVGRARRVFDLALAHAADRHQFGQPIGRFQGVSFKLADMITEIDAADWLTLSAAWRLDQGLSADREIASAKTLRHGDARAGHRRGDPGSRRHGADR